MRRVPQVMRYAIGAQPSHIFDMPDEPGKSEIRSIE